MVNLWNMEIEILARGYYKIIYFLTKQNIVNFHFGTSFFFWTYCIIFSFHKVDVQWKAHRSSSSLFNRSQSMFFSRGASLNGRPLVSVRSEGSTTLRKNLQVEKFSRTVPAPPQQRTDTNESHLLDYSSDDSGAEDDHIIRIDSPSNLSFRQAT